MNASTIFGIFILSGQLSLPDQDNPTKRYETNSLHRNMTRYCQCPYINLNAAEKYPNKEVTNITGTLFISILALNSAQINMGC